MAPYHKFITWHSMQCEHGSGSWAVIDQTLTINTAHGSKSVQLGIGCSPENTARALMVELKRDSADCA